MPSRRVVRWTVAAATLVALAGSAGCSAAVGSSVPSREFVATSSSAVAGTATATGPAPTTSTVPTELPAPPAAVVPAAAAAQADLALLPVKGRAPMTGYDRAQFGQAWADVDRNGCDTRNDVLRRDVSNAVIDPRTHGCVVLSGAVADPYSGTTIPFARGPDTSAQLQVDHVVALGDAWQTGAQQLDATRREQFANDPANLLVVDGALNAQKGDGDAATWLPPNVAFRCTYVAQQVAVKKAYGLWVTAAERDAVAGVLAGCPGATTPPAPPPAAPAPSEVYYENCAAARAAGATPILRGQPGYRPGLDRDDDGIACE